MRLGIQHGVFAAESRALYRRAQVQLGDTVLDVGCGPGFSALELAQIVGPSGTVYGLDGSRASLRKLADRAREHGWVDADAPRRATPRPDDARAPSAPGTLDNERVQEGNIIFQQ